MRKNALKTKNPQKTILNCIQSVPIEYDWSVNCEVVNLSVNCGVVNLSVNCEVVNLSVNCGVVNLCVLSIHGM